MDESVSEVILLIGLAVGVDYSLFYLRREREERAAGRSETAALEAAAATSGRAVLPMFLFVILFGLSMDYHVFILSRIREAYDRGLDTDAAVAHGIKSTAGVVTSAAVVMVAAFAVFAILPVIDMRRWESASRPPC